MRMMSRSKNIFFILLGVIAGSAMAQERVCTDVLELTDGTVLKGYIANQSFSTDLVFRSFEALITLPKEVVTVEPQNEKYEYLSTEWKAWIDENNIKMSGNEYFTLSKISINKPKENYALFEPVSISSATVYDALNPYEIVSDQKVFGEKKKPEATKQSKKSSEKESEYKKNEKQPITPPFSILSQLPSTLRGVHILEQGELYKFVDLHSTDYKISWSNIRKLTKVERDPYLLNGLKDVVVLKNGTTISGLITAQVPGNLFYLKPESGAVQVIKANNLSRHGRECINEKQSPIEQSPLLETVVLKNGERFDGVIISQTYEKQSENDAKFLSMHLTNGDIRPFTRESVLEIRRNVNDGYKPIYDICLETDTTMLVNEIEATFAELSQDDNCLYVVEAQDTVSYNKVDLPEGELLNLYVKDARIGDYVLYSCSKINLDKKNKSVKNNENIGLFFKDLITSSVVTKPEVSVNSRSVHTYQFRVPKTGWYIIYDQTSKKGILVEIK